MPHFLGADGLAALFIFSFMAAFFFRSAPPFLQVLVHDLQPAFKLVEVKFGAFIMEVPCWLLFMYHVLVPVPLRSCAPALFLCTFISIIMMQGWGLIHCDDATFATQQAYGWLSEWATVLVQGLLTTRNDLVSQSSCHSVFQSLAPSVSPVSLSLVLHVAAVSILNMINLVLDIMVACANVCVTFCCVALSARPDAALFNCVLTYCVAFGSALIFHIITILMITQQYS